MSDQFIPAEEVVGPVGPQNNPVFEAVGICHLCKNRTSVWKCKAFPDGIPTEILTGDFVHTKEYPGDRGITFERIIV